MSLYMYYIINLTSYIFRTSSINSSKSFNVAVSPSDVTSSTMVWKYCFTITAPRRTSLHSLRSWSQAEKIILMSVCLFVWGSLSHLRIYHFYEDVTIRGEGLQILTNTWHTWMMVIVQWGFFSLQHLLWHGARLYGHIWGPVTLTSVTPVLTI